MTSAKAQAKSLQTAPQTAGQDTLYPGARGHIIWLRDERKNAIFRDPKKMTSEQEIELLFAYTQDPAQLQSLRGAKATAAVKSFMLSLTHGREKRLPAHESEQLQIFLAPLALPKKTTAATPSRPAAARPTKRQSATRSKSH